MRDLDSNPFGYEADWVILSQLLSLPDIFYGEVVRVRGRKICVYYSELLGEMKLYG